MKLFLPLIVGAAVVIAAAKQHATAKPWPLVSTDAALTIMQATPTYLEALHSKLDGKAHRLSK